MNKIDYKSAYESVLIANGMLRQENNQLKQQKQELRIWLEDEINKGGSSIDLAIRIHALQEVLNRLEGKNE